MTDQTSKGIFVTLYLCVYLLLGLLVSSYYGEKWNKPISVREYFHITILLPVIFTAELYEEINTVLKSDQNLLDQCIVECQRGNKP